jgi:hypothetical protein
MTIQTNKHVPSSCKVKFRKSERLLATTSTVHEPVAIRRNVRFRDDKVEIDKDLDCLQ